MLGALRSSAKGWVAKILLVLLVASFAVWGVSGQITQGPGANTVLTAGETTVSADDYRLAYDRAFRGLQQRFGNGITREQARLFGIDQQVLSQLAAGAVLDEQARQMRLGLTQEGLAQVVAEDAQNWGAATFDRNTLQLVLRQIGMTEEQYVESLEDTAVRQQLVDASVDGTQAPQVFLDAFFAHQGETRDVSYMRVDDSALPAIPDPSDDDLQAYFDDNLETYRAPEYREIRYVRLTPEEIADPEAVDANLVRSEYDRNRSRFGEPERRAIQQVIFEGQEAAEAARERIIAGDSFETIVEETGRTMEDVSIGTLAQADVPDRTIATAAFALESTDDISEIIDGTFGPVLVRVTEIIEEQIQPFEDVEAEIRQELALVDANDVLLSVHDGYEDARAGGQSMEEAAEQQQLEVITIDAVDLQGRDPQGDTVEGPAEFRNMLAEAFQSEVLIENTPLPAGDGGFLWYEVVDVTPDRDRTLDEARNEVLSDWRAEQRAEQLDAEAERLVAALEDGAEVTALAEETGAEAGERLGVARNGTDTVLGPEALAAVFAAGPEEVGFAPVTEGAGRYVFRVDAINQPLGDGDSLEDDERTILASRFADDILDQMVGRAQREFSVTVNQTAIERAQVSHSGM